MKRFIVLVLCIILCSGSLVSCTEKVEIPEYYDYSFTAMDTVVTIRLAKKIDSTDKSSEAEYHEETYLGGVAGKCAKIIEKVENQLSRTNPSSLISEINSDTQYLLSFDKEVYDLIETSFKISHDTENAFDITVGSLTEAWNVTSDNPYVPDEGTISEALSHIGSDKLTLADGNITKNDTLCKLDLGAIGKGYALGKVLEYLNEKTDVEYGIVSIGGNIGVFGEKLQKDKEGTPDKFKVALTDPADTSAVKGYLYIDTGCVSVSGDYERYFEADGKKYHHIFDTATGYPAESDIASVAVWSDNATEADALSTALFVMGHDKALEFQKSGIYSFEALIIKKDGTYTATDGITSNAVFEEFLPETTDGGSN